MGQCRRVDSGCQFPAVRAFAQCVGQCVGQEFLLGALSFRSRSTRRRCAVPGPRLTRDWCWCQRSFEVIARTGSSGCHPTIGSEPAAKDPGTSSAERLGRGAAAAMRPVSASLRRRKPGLSRAVAAGSSPEVPQERVAGQVPERVTL